MGNTLVRVITDTNEFESLAGIWDSLLQKSMDDNSIYLSREWVTAWWKHFGEGKKLNIVLIEKEGEVIGIIPLMKAQYRIGLFKFHFLETIGPPDCNYIGLILPENREEAIATFLAYLGDELGRNKLVLRLDQIPEDSKFLELLRKEYTLFSNNLAFHEKVMALGPYISLPAAWDEYFRSLSSSRRWLLRRKQRALEEAHSVQFQQCTADSLKAGLSELFALHQRRWHSVNINSVFSNPKMKEFYRDISSQFLQKNWLHFSWLTADSKVVSATYGFIFNRKFYCLTAARDIQYSKYSVGHLHYMYLIKDAIKKHLREFDFLTSDEPYKFYWTKLARRYMRVAIIKRDLCPGLRFKFILAFLRLHEIRKYSLREIYSLILRKRREKKEKERMGLK